MIHEEVHKSDTGVESGLVSAIPTTESHPRKIAGPSLRNAATGSTPAFRLWKGVDGLGAKVFR